MDNNQQADMTADLTDERLTSAAADAFNKYLKTNPQIASYQACRAVAALARKGWRPIPQDEGDVMTLFEPRANSCHLVPPAADEESQELAEQLRELAEILTSMGFVTLSPPAWPSRLRRAAQQLEHQQAFRPVLASERPWERPGWCDEEGRCWMGCADGRDYCASWQLCYPRLASRLMKWSAPHWAHWAIFALPTGEES
jgi:hypothetical protein